MRFVIWKGIQFESELLWNVLQVRGNFNWLLKNAWIFRWLFESEIWTFTKKLCAWFWYEFGLMWARSFFSYDKLKQIDLLLVSKISFHFVNFKQRLNIFSSCWNMLGIVICYSSTKEIFSTLFYDWIIWPCHEFVSYDMNGFN